MFYVDYVAGSYIKYGGTGPVASEEKGIKTYKNNNEKTCTHKCQNTHGPKTCKSFGIKHMGQNASQDVAFQVCIYSNLVSSL